MLSPILRSVTLSGERVTIVPQNPRFAESAYQLIHAQEEIVRWLMWEGPSEPGELSSYYARWRSPGPRSCDYQFAILQRGDSGRACGSISARFGAHPGTADLGYWLGTDYWGRGFMTEAIRLVGWLCFRHLDADALCAWVFVGNEGSRVVLERNGFHLVRTVRSKAMKRGKPIDEWYFALLRSDWEKGIGDWRPSDEEVEFESANEEVR